MCKDTLLKTSLHQQHVSLGAKMCAEAGWDMPLFYRGVLAEAGCIRRRAGVFDVSHTGRIRIRGDGALEMLEKLCTADVAHQEDDTAIRTLLCNEAGGIIDDCLLVRTENFWLLTASAVCREKVFKHVETVAADFDLKFDDQTQRTSRIAVAGPAAEGILDAVLPAKPSAMPAGGVKVGSLMVARYIAMRTDYGGLWALEVIVPNMVAGQAWRFITERAGENCIAPAGLGARDVLRVEAGLHRYAHELNETIDPFTAGLECAVDFEHDFIGRDALLEKKKKQPAKRLVGLVLTTLKGKPCETNIPKLGSTAFQDGVDVGCVTSGTYSPTLEKTIAMAYVAPEAAETDTELLVEAGGERYPARVVTVPFVRP
ncbi:MAG: glycine cleavage system aminomethyltransferase GcvT [Planctomycetota bacterium]|nr:glycine cleavage system aminomethyltransferase GcvT [Planctomycetota bacterium]